MDDEETIWKLDATSLSGFAFHSSSSRSSCVSTTLDPTLGGALKWIHHSIEAVDIQVSQTLETHSFPYYLQMLLSPRTSQDPASPSTSTSTSTSTSNASRAPSTSSSSPASGVVLLLPLNHILSITISDHSPHGQTLRFKLTSPTNNRGIERIRQSLSTSGLGRMYGFNESDPFDVFGLLKFRELSVKIAGDRGRLGGEAVVGWTECLRRNAETEWGWGVQILREGEDGIWGILEWNDGREDGMVGSGEERGLVKSDNGKMEIDGDGEDEMDEAGRLLRIPSVEVSEGTLVSDTPASDLDHESVSGRPSYEHLERETHFPKKPPRQQDKPNLSPSHPTTAPGTKQPDDGPRTPQERSPSPPASDTMSMEDGERRRESDDTTPERPAHEGTRSPRSPSKENNGREYSRSPPPFRPKLTGANKIDLSSYNRNYHKHDTGRSPPPYAYSQERSPFRRYDSITTRSTPPFRRHYNNKPYEFSPQSDRYNYYHTARRHSTSDAMTKSSEPYRSYSYTSPDRRYDTYKPYIPYRRPGYQPRFQREENTSRYDGKRSIGRNGYNDEKRFGSDHGEKSRSLVMQEENTGFPPRKENYFRKRVPQIERRE